MKLTQLQIAQQEAVDKITAALAAAKLLDHHEPDSDCCGYVRMSRAIGTEAKGVERDAVEVVRWAKRNGLKLRTDPETGLPVYVDNSLSASRFAKHGGRLDDNQRRRPAHARIIGGVTLGVVKRIVTPHMDRLYRKPSELEQLFALLDERERAGQQLHVEQLYGGTVDLNNSDARLNARIGVAVAAHQSDRTHDRIVQDVAATKRRGDWLGGQPPMGMLLCDETCPEEHHGLHHDPETADVVRDAIDALIDGTSQGVVAQQWEQQHVPRKRDAQEPWDARSVGQALDRCSLAGLYGDGAQGRWEPIVDAGGWAALQLVFEENRQRYGKARTTGAFTGLFLCECGRPLYRNETYKGKRGAYSMNGHVWRCLKRGSGRKHKGCGSCSVVGLEAEQWARREAMRRFKDHRVAAVARAKDADGAVAAARRELHELEKRLRELERGYNAGKVRARSFYRMSDELDGQIDAANRALGQATLRTIGRDLPDDLFERDLLDPAQWDVLDPDEQNRLLRAAFPRGVLVRKAGKRNGNSFDESRMQAVDGP